MGQLSQILRDAEDADGGRYLTFRCPGCAMAHPVKVVGPGSWGWNSNVDKPTFTPSVLVQGVAPMTDEQRVAYMRGEGLPTPQPFVCHSFVTDGRIQFLGDCTHSLVGQTVDLPEWPRAE